MRVVRWLSRLSSLLAASASCGAPLMKLPSGPGAPRAGRGRRARAGHGGLPRHPHADRGNRASAERSAASGSAARLLGRRSPRRHRRASRRSRRSARRSSSSSRRDDDATLLLPRDDRVLEHGRADAVLEAVAGVPLGAADLRIDADRLRADDARASEARRSAPTGAWLDLAATTICICIAPKRAAAVAAAVAAASTPRRAWRGEYRDFVRTVCRARSGSRASTATQPATTRSICSWRCRRSRPTCRSAPTRFRRSDVPRRSRSTNCAIGPLDEPESMSAAPLARRRPRKLICRCACSARAPTAITSCGPIFQSIALHDTLTFVARRGPFRARLRRSGAVRPTTTNLVWRAAASMWRAAGTPRRAARRRRSDLASGFRCRPGSAAAAAMRRRRCARSRRGGASTDAQRCTRSAAALGADVPFFLEGGTALGLERGDLLFPLVDAPPAWVVLVLPAFGVSTKDAFGWWDDGRGPAGPAGSGVLCGAAARRARQRSRGAGGGAHHPEIGRIVRRLRRPGAIAGGDVGQRLGGFRPVSRRERRAGRAPRTRWRRGRAGRSSRGRSTARTTRALAATKPIG